jgi:hypothetical protein
MLRVFDFCQLRFIEQEENRVNLEKYLTNIVGFGSFAACQHRIKPMAATGCKAAIDLDSPNADHRD